MLETAAETDELDAVVSEGAGARDMGEAIDDPAHPRPRTDRSRRSRTRSAISAMAVSANELPPKHLKRPRRSRSSSRRC